LVRVNFRDSDSFFENEVESDAERKLSFDRSKQKGAPQGAFRVS